MAERRRVGITLPGAVTPAQAARLAAAAEAAGAASIWVLDVRREPYLLSAAALWATTSIRVGTNVAVAFARSPTVTANAAWDLGLSSEGRFVLGLGSQVGPTLAARFGVEADRPGPRMRDYVGAVRDCFGALRSGYGRHDGPFYKIRRPAFQPGPDHGPPDPPIYVAGVNPVMTRVAGEVADGFAAHPFTTGPYLDEVLRPALAAGAATAGRRPPEILLQLVVTPDRDSAAVQMSAYAVPAYRRVLDHAGLGEVADRVMEAATQGRRADARDLVDSDLVDVLGVVVGSDPDSIAAGVDRWSVHAEHITLGVPWFGLDPADQLRQAERLVTAMERI